jgi:hypothetical protein
MEEITEAGEIGTEVLEDLDFPFILILIPKNRTSCSKLSYLTRLAME